MGIISYILLIILSGSITSLHQMVMNIIHFKKKHDLLHCDKSTNGFWSSALKTHKVLFLYIKDGNVHEISHKRI